MRRRFGRGRGRGGRGGGREKDTAIDAERWLQRIIDDGVVAAASLTPAEVEEIPDSFAAVGTGEAQDGTKLVVGFAPHHGGDAALAAIALGARLAASEEGFDGEVVAVAPQWSTDARRRLGWVGQLPFRFRALGATSLADGNVVVEPEQAGDAASLSVSQIAAQLGDVGQREVFERAAVALDGLASKHGGSIRGHAGALELVLLARRVAELVADSEGVRLNTILPQRSSVQLGAEDLAGVLDRLEGNLRKRLNDRRVGEGEEGLRARALPLLATARGLRSIVPWPLGGGDPEVLDLAGVDAQGQAVVGVVRQQLDLPTLAALLDAAGRIRPFLPSVLANAGPPLRLDAAKLILAAEGYDEIVAQVLPLLDAGFELFELRAGRGKDLGVTSVAEGETPVRTRARRSPRPPRDRDRDRDRNRDRDRDRDEDRDREAAAGDEPAAEASAEVAEESERGSGRGRARRRGGRRRGSRSEGSNEGDGNGEAPGNGADAEEAPARFEEISLFDLDDDRGDSDEGNSRRRRGRSRRRGGRRGGSSDQGDSESSEDAPSPDAAEADSGGRGRGRSRRGARSESAPPAARNGDDSNDEDLVDDEDVDPRELVADVPQFEVLDGPRYDPEEEPDGEVDPENEQRSIELEQRRRSRKAASPAEEAPKPPRRRAAIVAHADRDSLLSAIVLARDVRLLEGFWVYPQEELMTFFRSVATDLKEGTPIYVVGFTPSPARDVIQAAALYGERVTWFDHHDWPPEDVLAVQQTIGADNLHLQQGTGSSMPDVVASCTRRSRFSDKLVDLGVGRFTQHDYERWGRVWWDRLTRFAATPGERRGDVEPLLAGRPSDLAKEAALVERPPLPAELEFVSSRDFRLVHFAGYSMVVVAVPEEMDLHLAARIARERYSAGLAVSYTEGSELVVLSGEEISGRRTLDFGALVEHLAHKLEWVTPLADQDHVARFRVAELASHPDRLDEVIAEIAMGRSILEG